MTQPFVWGVGTSAYQIETAFEHDWVNVKSRDGNVFCRTTDHEKKLKEDIRIITSLAPHYRMSLMWSRLQRRGDFPGGLKDIDTALSTFRDLVDVVVDADVDAAAEAAGLH